MRLAEHKNIRHDESAYRHWSQRRRTARQQDEGGAGVEDACGRTEDELGTIGDRLFNADKVLGRIDRRERPAA